jgi:HEPN domain-containing protein
MPSDAPTPGSPEDWLRHARSDLALARQRNAPDILLTTLCFHTQQAVEKGIKAVLVQRGIVFPYTHDLARLITLVRDARLPWPEELDAAAALTEYAVGSRYPGPSGEISETEYQQAITVAQRVLDWSENTIRQPPQTGDTCC